MKRGKQLEPLARAMREVALRCDDDALALRLKGAAMYLDSDERGEVWASNDDARYGIALAEALWHGTAVPLAEAAVALAEELTGATAPTEDDMKHGNITTTTGETFTHVESVDMARLVWKRFGRDSEAAAAAWRRLLGNSCTEAQFMELVEYSEHTPHCAGECVGP